MSLEILSNYIAATAGLGTAAFGLVDGSKAFWGGVSNCGFRHIKRAVTNFFPDKDNPANPIRLKPVLAALRANWLNGVALTDQTAYAQSLITLHLTSDNAPDLAQKIEVDKAMLTALAQKKASGLSISPEETSTLDRFNLMVKAILDEGYKRADQSYRNSAKAWSIAVAVVLAIIGRWILKGAILTGHEFAMALLMGLAATPIAPSAKDLTSALSAGVKIAQSKT